MRVLLSLAAAVLLLTSACSSDATGTDDAGADGGASSEGAASATPVPTLSPLPIPPEPPPSDRLLADMRQSSLDAAAGQSEVWVDNDTLRDLVPVRITYSDPRLPRPVVLTRMRGMPAQAERGFPLALPDRPRCGVDAPPESGRVEVRTEDGATYRARVTDETDVIGRYVAARCGELRLRRVVDLSWSPSVFDGEPAQGDVGGLVLRLRPTGVPGRVRILTVGGSHLLGSADGRPWSPDVVVRGTDAPSEVVLPLLPARCDDHAFMEGGNAFAFRVGYVVDGPDGRPAGRTEGSLLLRMDQEGAGNALRFARASCGLD